MRISKDNLLNKIVMKTLDQIQQVVGAECVMNVGIPAMVKGSEHMRLPLLEFTIKHELRIKHVEFKQMIKPVLIIVRANQPNIRKLGKQMLRSFLKFFDAEKFKDQANKEKTMIAEELNIVIKQCNGNDNAAVERVSGGRPPLRGGRS